MNELQIDYDIVIMSVDEFLTSAAYAIAEENEWRTLSFGAPSYFEYNEENTL